jgi:uncharacterized damage-inducible protein DinB
VASPGPFVTALRTVLLRDLSTVRREIEAYPDDVSPWAEHGGLANPGGNLALHVAGNLQHFIGRNLGGSDYVRDRDAEFARRSGSRADIVAAVEAARAAVERTLGGLGDEALSAAYPQEVGGRRLVTGDFLTHLAVHLAYHLGQLDAHRRAVTGDRSGVGAMGLDALPGA